MGSMTRSEMLRRLAAEQEAAQVASSEPDEAERGVGTDMPCEPSQPDPSSPVAPGALSGSLGAEADATEDEIAVRMAMSWAPREYKLKGDAAFDRLLAGKEAG